MTRKSRSMEPWTHHTSADVRAAFAEVSPRALLRIDMIGNRISDLTPLALLQVAELQEINLENNEITDVMALVGLQTLLLSNNSIVDLSALAGLTDLDDLGLSNNRIEDIGPLFGLSKLEYLGLSLNPKISCSDVDELATAIPDAEITAFDCTP